MLEEGKIIEIRFARGRTAWKMREKQHCVLLVFLESFWESSALLRQNEMSESLWQEPAETVAEFVIMFVNFILKHCP